MQVFLTKEACLDIYTNLDNDTIMESEMESREINIESENIYIYIYLGTPLY